MILAHPAAALHHLEPAPLELVDALRKRLPVHVVRDVVDALAVLREELLEDVGAGHGLDDLVDHRVAQLGEADAQLEGAGAAAVRLVGRVGGREGVDAPRPDAELVQAADGALVVGRDDADFHGVAQEGLLGVGHGRYVG